MSAFFSFLSILHLISSRIRLPASHLAIVLCRVICLVSSVRSSRQRTLMASPSSMQLDVSPLLCLSDDIVRERLLSVSHPMLLSFSACLLMDAVLHTFLGDRSCIVSLSPPDIQFLCSSYEPFNGMHVLSVESRANLPNVIPDDTILACCCDYYNTTVWTSPPVCAASTRRRASQDHFDEFTEPNSQAPCNLE